jgi:hypothetical protein
MADETVCLAFAKPIGPLTVVSVSKANAIDVALYSFPLEVEHTIVLFEPTIRHYSALLLLEYACVAWRGLQRVRRVVSTAGLIVQRHLYVSGKRQSVGLGSRSPPMAVPQGTGWMRFFGFLLLLLPSP